ncbi:unnamed protein product [Trifolium pratense]|uniref:Uncharacterized protein n=1 Tax=Trifolium pratense TaxID=57577 RepID=A0ACB0J109_TRIPR|nr:unnamed protein product [Trifolium pratense]
MKPISSQIFSASTQLQTARKNLTQPSTSKWQLPLLCMHTGTSLKSTELGGNGLELSGSTALLPTFLLTSSSLLSKWDSQEALETTCSKIRLRELLHTLKGHIESVVKFKGLEIETIQQQYSLKKRAIS